MRLSRLDRHRHGRPHLASGSADDKKVYMIHDKEVYMIRHPIYMIFQQVSMIGAGASGQQIGV